MAEENRVYLEVMNYIKEGLRDGTLEAGAKLPTERDMSAQLNISRNSIREALRTLDNMGVLECRQGSGNYLRGTLGHGFTDALSMHILMAAVSTREIVQVMRGIEIESLSEIMQTGQDWDIDELERLVEKIDAGGPESEEADRQFHASICAPMNNGLFSCVADAVGEAAWETMYHDLSDEERSATNYCHHEILEGLRHHDRERAFNGIVHHYDIIRVATYAKYKPRATADARAELLKELNNRLK